MTIMKIPISSALLALLAVSHSFVDARERAIDGTVLVDSVASGRRAATAGLRAGDRLISWRRDSGIDPKQGSFRSPFDVAEVEHEEAPRGAVFLRIERSKALLDVELDGDGWGIEARPELPDSLLALLDAAARPGKVDSERAELLGSISRLEPATASWLLVRLAEDADIEWATALFDSAAAIAPDDRQKARVRSTQGLAALGRQDDERAALAFTIELSIREKLGRDLAWSEASHNLATALASLRMPDFSEQLFLDSLAIRQRLALSRPVESRTRLALATLESHRENRSEACFREAIVSLEQIAPAGDDLGWAYLKFSTALLQRKDFEGATAWAERALTTFEATSAESLDSAEALRHLGESARGRQNTLDALRFFARGLAIRERLEPNSFATGEAHHDLAVAAWDRGRLSEADRHYHQALGIFERLAPDSESLAATTSDFAAVLSERGDLGAAVAWSRRAVSMMERIAPESRVLAISANNLAVNLRNQGDHDGAVAWYRRAISMVERIEPESLLLAQFLQNLGVAHVRRGEFDEAVRLQEQSALLRERIAPVSLSAMASARELGNSLRMKGDLDEAECWTRRAIALAERLGPDAASGPDMGSACHNLGAILASRRLPGEAEHWFLRAYAIQSRQASGFSPVMLGDLAWILRDRDRQLAIELLTKGIEIVEDRQTRLGGKSDNLAAFRTKYLVLYRRLIELLIEAGQLDEAARLVEAARARSLLALLAERDVEDRDLPRELEDERRQGRKQYEQALRAQGQASDDVARQRAGSQLQEARIRQDAIRERIRAASPRLAALRDPILLDRRGIQAQLESGDLLIGWLLGDERSILVAITATSVELHLLEVSEESVRRRVGMVRRRIAAIDDATSTLTALSNDLLGPVSSQVASATRILFQPDGPLWLLPLGLLADGDGSRLIEKHPLSVIPSMTVLANLRAGRAKRPMSVVAFGDPVYPAEPIPIGLRPTRFEPLPGTRAEVNAIGRRLTTGFTAYVGAEATEQRAKSIGRGPTIVHFAAHGFVDERSGLESGIALDVDPNYDPTDAGTKENGLLQAWEIIEGIRLDADLVVLSACETALGGAIAGEGLLGLTRAFQYAGARSVLASLWAVPDESTAELMVRFYRGLADGQARDEALRAAQDEMAAGPITTEGGQMLDATHPFHWAAFQLYGVGD